MKGRGEKKEEKEEEAVMAATRERKKRDILAFATSFYLYFWSHNAGPLTAQAFGLLSTSP